VFWFVDRLLLAVHSEIGLTTKIEVLVMYTGGAARTVFTMLSFVALWPAFSPRSRTDAETPYLFDIYHWQGSQYLNKSAVRDLSRGNVYLLWAGEILHFLMKPERIVW